jgi:hypothetical protein
MSKVAKIRTIASQRSFSHQSRLPASTNFLNATHQLVGILAGENGMWLGKEGFSEILI